MVDRLQQRRRGDVVRAAFDADRALSRVRAASRSVRLASRRRLVLAGRALPPPARWRQPRLLRAWPAWCRHCRESKGASRSGRNRLSCAVRRGELVPTRAPCGSSAIEPAPISRSRMSARGSIAAIVSVAGRSLSTSFIECTEQWVSPSQQGEIQLLGPQRLAANFGQRPVLDAVAAGLHRLDLDAALGQPCACSSAAATMRAWASASGDPRLPIVKRGSVIFPALAQRRGFQAKAGCNGTDIGP